MIYLKNKKGQIWVETIIYTLIAFIMIGLVLGFANPKINEIQDKAILDQTVAVLEDIHNVVQDISTVPGNKRVIELSIKQGDLKIDGINNQIIFETESAHLYSQPNENITHGNVNVLTIEKGSMYFVTLTGNYNSYDLTFTGNNDTKILSKSPTPYKIFITNKGGNPQNIDFEIG